MPLVALALSASQLAVAQSDSPEATVHVINPTSSVDVRSLPPPMHVSRDEIRKRFYPTLDPQALGELQATAAVSGHWHVHAAPERSRSADRCGRGARCGDPV